MKSTMKKAINSDKQSYQKIEFSYELCNNKIHKTTIEEANAEYELLKYIRITDTL